MCYNHPWWNLRRDSDVQFFGEIVYVFAFDDGSGGKKLVANPPCAGEDIP